MEGHGKFLTTLILSPTPGGMTWKLDFPFAYAPALGGHITVPAGFVTDLASIPRVFWNILPPFGRYTEAAVLHDWLYRTHRVPRAGADALLLEAMEVCRVARWQRRVIYIAVRLFGGFAWRNEKRWVQPKPNIKP